MRPLFATYRLELRDGTDLANARALVSYLERLGASHVNLSPVMRAREGSTRGRDGVDPREVDPALGGEKALSRLADALHAHGLGILLDIVPDHLAATPENPFFDDVLARGRRSRYARWFDIQWRPPGRARTTPLLLPVLERPLADAIERGELSVERGEGGVRVRYRDQSFPVAPETTLPGLERGALERFARGADGRARLTRLLQRQRYRLSFWRRARHELNYRRFLDRNDRIGVRVEDPEVFDAVHAKVLALVERGAVDGLRIEWIDGLLDPHGYLERLRTEVRARREDDVPILVEKVLARGEMLPRAWPVEGTAGLDFANEVEAALLDPEGAARVEAGWQRLVGGQSFDECAREAKRFVLHELLRADVARLAGELHAAPSKDRRPPVPEIESALVEGISELPVYRAYADPQHGLTPEDRDRLRDAFARARGRAPERALSFVRRALLPRSVGPPRSGATRRSLELLQRFQQVTAAAAARGAGDTALYRHVALLSRNEPGADPGAPLDRALEDLHASNAHRARFWPRTLLAATAHDARRSADVRARLDVLSELPDAWLDAVARWRRWNQPLKTGVLGQRLPDANTEYFLYQTLVGVFPLPDPRRAPGAIPIEARLAELRDRVVAYMEKACREAGRQSSWIDPDARFEAAVRSFAGGLLDPEASPIFLADLARFASEIARPGLWNALTRTLVQLAAPGVPELRQGDELFRFALAGPDDRRPVDFAHRRRRLREVEAGTKGDARRRGRFLQRLVQEPEDGRIKLHLVRAALAARRRHPQLFEGGSYRALTARGPHAAHVVAFLRREGGRIAVAVAPRRPRTLVGDATRAPVGKEVWSDTELRLPGALAGRRLECALTGARVRVASNARLPLGRVLDPLPVGLLLG